MGLALDFYRLSDKEHWGLLRRLRNEPVTRKNPQIPTLEVETAQLRRERDSQNTTLRLIDFADTAGFTLYKSMVISLALGVKWVINGYSYIGTADGTLFAIGPAKEVYEGIHREERTAKLQPFIAEKKLNRNPALAGFVFYCWI